MLIKEYLRMAFPNLPKGIKDNNELIREVDRSIKTDYPGSISVKVFRNTQTKQLIFHIMIPSRKKKSVEYDVIIQVDLSDVSEPTIPIEELPFKVFSNSPSFVFSCARAFQKHGVFCDWLQTKYDSRVMSEPAGIRNPNDNILYERTVFTALYWICRLRYHNKGALSVYHMATPANSRSISQRIKSQDGVTVKYDMSKDTKQEKIRKAEVEARKVARKEAKQPKDINAVKSTAFTSTTKSSTRMKKTHSSSKVKKL